MIKYEFATGEVIEIDIPDELEEVIIEIEKAQYKKNRVETMRHSSIEDKEKQGVQFKDNCEDVIKIIELMMNLNPYIRQWINCSHSNRN